MNAAPRMQDFHHSGQISSLDGHLLHCSFHHCSRVAAEHAINKMVQVTPITSLEYTTSTIIQGNGNTHGNTTTSLSSSKLYIILTWKYITVPASLYPRTLPISTVEHTSNERQLLSTTFKGNEDYKDR